MKRAIDAIMFCVVTGAASAQVGAADAQVERGAELFAQRCILCHGSDGRGEGPLPLTLKSYPDTNLTKARSAKGVAEVRRAIEDGGSKGAMSIESPPWADELPAADIEALTAFVAHLRSDSESAADMLRRVVKDDRPSAGLGARVFANYCSLCHGATGEGNGKMAKVIKDPPPFNLTKSNADDAYLLQIIAAGGEAMGRSARMPPWGAQLSGSELMSVILHLKSIRK
jgi:cytochrome c oxidase cbb3-type subunit 3